MGWQTYTVRGQTVNVLGLEAINVLCYISNLICILKYFENVKKIFLALSMSAQSCLTLCNPIDCSRQGFSVHRIFQARLLDRVAISYSRRSSRPRDRT